MTKSGPKWLGSDVFSGRERRASGVSCRVAGQPATAALLSDDNVGHGRRRPDAASLPRACDEQQADDGLPAGSQFCARAGSGRNPKSGLGCLASAGHGCAASPGAPRHRTWGGALGCALCRAWQPKRAAPPAGCGSAHPIRQATQSWKQPHTRRQTRGRHNNTTSGRHNSPSGQRSNKGDAATPAGATRPSATSRI